MKYCADFFPAFTQIDRERLEFEELPHYRQLASKTADVKIGYFQWEFHGKKQRFVVTSKKSSKFTFEFHRDLKISLKVNADRHFFIDFLLQKIPNLRSISFLKVSSYPS